MTTQRRHEIIEILDCDLDVRPKAASGIEQLMPYVRTARRATGALLVEFEEQVGETLVAFVEAERLCCAGIGWEIERGAVLRLRITASDAQISAIESLWKPSKIESHQ